MIFKATLSGQASPGQFAKYSTILSWTGTNLSFPPLPLQTVIMPPIRSTSSILSRRTSFIRKPQQYSNRITVGITRCLVGAFFLKGKLSAAVNNRCTSSAVNIWGTKLELFFSLLVSGTYEMPSCPYAKAEKARIVLWRWIFVRFERYTEQYGSMIKKSQGKECDFSEKNRRIVDGDVWRPKNSFIVFRNMAVYADTP